MRRLLLVALCALVFASSADARPLLGVVGEASRFRSHTGQHSDVEMVFLGWGQTYRAGGLYLDEWFPQLGEIPMISFGTARRGREAITPRAIAKGRGDRWLIALNRAIHRWGKPIYMRPLAEMNGHWNYYCAYNSNGTLRNAAHRQKELRRAFRRIYLILHGGDRATLNRRLRALDMPGVAVDLAVNPAPTLKVVWNPQGFGSPNVAGNRAAAYYPGRWYVDVVANDLYDIRFRAAWEANEKLYRAYPGKPYAIGEFGLWGIDDPAFIRRMARFARTHSRVELVVYYKSGRGSQFDLATKPRSRAAYRTYLTPLGR